MQRVPGLLWPLVLSVALLPVASWFAYPETHLPPGFGVFPPLFVADPPGFKPVIFVVLALIETAIVLLLLFPQCFGFIMTASPPRADPARFPVWFRPGAALTLFFWWLMWIRVTPFDSLAYYAFTPLWWGFILTLDGLVYRRSGGYSLLASRPGTLLTSAAVSLAGWCYFEYLNYFALGNWYYPNSTMPELSHGAVVLIYLFAYTTVWPAVFEWYTLLNTFPSLVCRYSCGPRIALPGGLLLWGGFFLLFAMVFFPYPLFWTVWIGPLAIFSGQLLRKGIWNPFTALAQGNWSPALLMALSALFNGFFWELWNWGSAYPAQPVANPNYWMYAIPYVNAIHIFAEMPLLGYMGYMPFGILAWALFIWLGALFGFDAALLKDDADRR
ncbi:mechanosensitive ion channel protein MscS [Candidatus Methylospira mobilis]|uniref:Mechanosensitive ion channel protein MscS n=1 Tax=Candidatus Methylospira mobilis TaxID=1808979 RepID=A0A5Q0BN95_9GAMM|nr:mechanosensitive ion channel protein MscS [Candidatus Methylospira mobilis]QFY43577.1 mechanosensitive ion channel protein MscS [Candidatus Methylospira mobilis]WNV03883.1 mechanosensitive ion channel protein MscS [Candidatus Methylospira mobilis]